MIRRLIAIVVLLMLVITTYVAVPVISDPADDYFLRKGKLSSTIVNKQWLNEDSLYTEIALISTSGLRVTLLVRRPKLAVNKPLPVVLLLGGLETGHKSCELIPLIKNVICASLSYPGYTPKRYAGVKFFYRIHDLQTAIQRTPPAVGLVTDYLLQQNYTDKNHLEYIGVSLGAFFISVPAVKEQRVSRVWIVQGSANPVATIRHNFLKHVDSEWLATAFSYIVGYSIGAQYIDPVRWIGKIAPRKVAIVNSKQDEALLLTEVKHLHHAASDPKEIIWTEGSHITSTRKNVIAQLSDIILNRIAKDNE